MSSVFVKFMLTNTGHESIQVLEQKVISLEAAKKETENALKSATAAATTASNKVDETKKLMIVLGKQVKKLE